MLQVRSPATTVSFPTNEKLIVELHVTIADKQVVSIHYTLTDDDGEIIDSSSGDNPLTYLHGAQNIIPGLEAALVGKNVGDEVKVTIEPAEGYGELDPELVQLVPRDAFDGVDDIEAGMQFEAQSPEGESQVVEVREVNEEGVVIDGNHPLAGQTLHFEVKVEEVREASEEEVAHGHAHGPDGHHDH